MLTEQTHWSPEELMPCVSEIYALIRDEQCKYRAVRRKYSSRKYMVAPPRPP